MTEILIRQRVTTFMTHLLCIIILFGLPELLSSLANPDRPIKLWVYARTLVYLGAFYANYYWLIERSFGKNRHLIRFFVYNVILIIISLGLIYLIWRFKGYLGGTTPLRKFESPTEMMFLIKASGMLSRDLIMLVLVIGFATALRLGDKWIKLERDRQDLLNCQREEEMKNLKSQLNPHFLFNTLNSIYALIAISPEKAQGAVHELSRLLRYVLYDTSATVSLKQEVDFVRNYISLMKIRLSPSVILRVDLDSGSNDSVHIAPLIFITLIENVFKHGIHTPSVPLYISITARDGVITCMTSNGYDMEKQSRDARKQDSEGGIGLINLRRRLALIYGDDAKLEISRADGIYRVRLVIDTNDAGHRLRE